MLKARFAIAFGAVLAAGLLAAPAVLAQGGSAVVGAGLETATNNLSDPTIFVPDASSFADLNCLGGVTDPTGTSTDGYYLQGHADWQAQCGTDASLAGVSAAWGDTFGTSQVTAGTPIHVELALTTTVASPMVGYQVVMVAPSQDGQAATYGTSGAQQPDVTVGVWAEGATLEIVSSNGNVVYSGPAAAEINSMGQVVYGYEWGSGSGPSAEAAAGEYTVTLSAPAVTFKDGLHSASLSLTVASNDGGQGGNDQSGGEGAGTLPGMCNGRTDASTNLVAQAGGSGSGVQSLVLNVTTNAAGVITGRLVVDVGSTQMQVSDWCRLWEHLPGTVPKGDCEAGYPDGANTGHVVGLTTVDGQQTLVRVDVRELADGTSLYRVRYKAWTGEDSESESGDDCSGWTWVPGAPTEESWGALNQLTIEPKPMGGGDGGPTITTNTIPSGPVAIGGSVYDTATLSGPASNPPGTVTYKLYSDSACTDPVADLTPEADSVSHAVVPDSDPYTFTSAGTYYFQAAYDGNGQQAHAISDCASEVVVVDPNHPTISTQLSTSGPIVTGTVVHDTATLTGATGAAGGTVTYKVYSDSACSAFVADITPSSNAVVNGVVPSSESIGFTSAGTYYFQATYNGDHNNFGPVSSRCTSEAITVNAPAGGVLGASTGVPGTGAGIGPGAAILLLGTTLAGFGVAMRRRGSRAAG